MTINIAVVTSEALVLGCDSISSTTGYFIDPFEHPTEPTEDGKLRFTCDPGAIMAQVTNTWDGVMKMLELHTGDRTPVAAVTAGLAKLNDRTMNSYAQEFFADHGNELSKLHSVQDVANSFLVFMRARYEEHYAGSAVPPDYQDGPLYLVGGYGRTDQLPSLYRVNVQRNTARAQYPAGRFGIAWEGQSDAVERVIRGYDSAVRRSIEHEVKAGVETLRRDFAESVASALQAIVEQGGKVPDGFAAELPVAPEIALGWDQFHSPIFYGNLPLQDAVDFAAFLVGIQSGKAKFAAGVPTVGGRTHIGVITRKDGFVMLDEPQLKHRNVGFVG